MKTLRSLPGLTAVGLSALLLTLAACGGGETEAPAPEPKAEEAPKTPEDPGVDKEELEGDKTDTSNIVPSPTETANALEEAGVSTKLATLIEKHDFDIEKADQDHAAIRTGVTLADLLLTVKTAEKADLVTRLETVKKGMGQLNGGKDIDAVLADIVDRVKADAVQRDELLQEFEELSQVVIPELEFNGNERIVPLIQAGSWLEAAHLVAKAVKGSEALKEGEASVADDLLKQPEVCDYFLKYVKTEGAEKAPEQVTQKLDESLNELKKLSGKKEPLVAADIDQVVKVTQDVLALL